MTLRWRAGVSYEAAAVRAGMRELVRGSAKWWRRKQISVAGDLCRKISQLRFVIPLNALADENWDRE